MITQQNQRPGMIGNVRHRLHDGMTRTPPLGLDHPIDTISTTGFSDAIGTAANHDMNLHRIQRDSRLQKMQQHGPPAQCLQHFR